MKVYKMQFEAILSVIVFRAVSAVALLLLVMSIYDTSSASHVYLRPRFFSCVPRFHKNTDYSNWDAEKH